MENKSFSEIYDDLLNGKESIDDVVLFMKSSEARKRINPYLYKDKINALVPYSEYDLQNIQSIVNIAQFIYNNSGEDTGLTDPEYDILYATMIANGGNDIISAPIIIGRKNVEHHKYPNLRGSLTKIHYLTKDEEKDNKSRRYLDDWKSEMESKYFQNTGKRINLDEEEVWVFPKFDGVSGIFEYDKDGNLERVLTRGYTELNEAENITLHFKSSDFRTYHLKENSTIGYYGGAGPVIKNNKPFGLKTEIMMTDDDFKFYNENYNSNYKQSRSIVSAIINSDEYDPVKASLLHIVPLRTYVDGEEQKLAKEAFTKYPYIRCRLKDRELIRKFAIDHFYVNGLRCDGAVIYFINPLVQKGLGRENHKNNWEVAYKFTEESCLTKLKDIVFNVGLFGRLAPVAKVKPVVLKGNTIENISVGSIGRLKSLHLKKGDTVKILYDIIPYIAFDKDCSHSTGDEFKIPITCPECGSDLVFSESGDIASCVNEKCPCRIKGKILNYLNKMNIENLSYGVIDKLYDYGIIKSIEDLYKIKSKRKEIETIDGFGEKSVKLFIDSIDDKREVYDYVFLGSIGIEGVSKKTFQSIMSIYSVEELLEIAENKDMKRIYALKGIQEKTALKIINGLNENKKLIKFLDKELIVIPTKGIVRNAKFSVCFTSFREDEKKDIKEYIKNKGGVITDSLTKDVTYLIVPSHDTNSSKVAKAKKYNIPTYTIDEFKSVVD